MSRTRLPIILHLPPADIFRRYRACRRGVEKTHWHLLWLLTRPEPPLAPAQAAAAGRPDGRLGPRDPEALECRGPDGLADRRAGACGGRSKLTTDQQIDLWAALQHPPPDGGLWTGPKVARYVRDRWGIRRKPTGWGWMRGPGFSEGSCTESSLEPSATTSKLEYASNRQVVRAVGAGRHGGEVPRRR